MALSLAPKSLQESYRSAKEVLLVEWNGSLNRGDGQNAGAHSKRGSGLLLSHLMFTLFLMF